MNNEFKFICVCHKEFLTAISLSHHKTHCKVFQDQKKAEKQKELDAKKLPNGKFCCENPDCGKEHDGSYASGRFCCEKCKRHYNSITGAQTMIRNGTKHAPVNFKAKQAPYGTWKCPDCGLVLPTREKLYDH